MSTTTQMYMKVTKVKGDVTTPMALKGAIQLQDLSWPGGSQWHSSLAVPVGAMQNRSGPTDAKRYPDFTGKSVTVKAVAGGHTHQLSQLFTMQRTRSDVTVEIWIALGHNRFLRGVLTEVMLESQEATVEFQANSQLRLEKYTFSATSGKMRAA